MKDQLDKRVLYSFTIIICLIVIFLLLRVKCRQEFIVEYRIPDTVSVGQTVLVEDLTKNANEWEWDFGDGKEYSYEKTTQHVYSMVGTYDINLLINGKYNLLKKIVVVNHPIEAITEIKTDVAKDNKNPKRVKHKKPQVVTVKPFNGENEKLITPVYLEGDKKLSGEISIFGTVELRISADSTQIYAGVYAWFKESEGDKPTKYGINGLKEGKIKLFDAPPSKKIIKIPNDQIQFNFKSSQRGDSEIVSHYTNFVKSIIITSDKTGRKNREFKFNILFNSFNVELIDK